MVSNVGGRGGKEDGAVSLKLTNSPEQVAEEESCHRGSGEDVTIREASCRSAADGMKQAHKNKKYRLKMERKNFLLQQVEHVEYPL